MMEREPGFCWIQRSGEPPEVALWQTAAWWIAGAILPAREAEVAVFSPRLHAPALLSS